MVTWDGYILTCLHRINCLSGQRFRQDRRFLTIVLWGMDEDCRLCDSACILQPINAASDRSLDGLGNMPMGDDPALP